MRKKSLRTRKGSVLMVTLWIITLLSFMSVSLGRKAYLEISLTRYMQGQIKSKYCAWAGIMQAVMDFKRMTQREKSKGFEEDIAPVDGVNLELYKSLPNYDDLCPSTDCIFAKSHIVNLGQAGETLVAMIPEEAKVNINGLTMHNINLFVELLDLLGVEHEASQIISYSVLDWKDTDRVLSHRQYGAEYLHYNSLSRDYKCKDAPFDTINELLLVRGMTREIFDKLKPYVSVYPRQGRLAINFYLAPQVILEAVANSAVGPTTNTSRDDAQSLAKKIVDHRSKHPDLYNNIDVQLTEGDYGLNAKEKVIWMAIQSYRAHTIRYMRVYAWGRDNSSDITTLLETIIERDKLSLVYWKRH